jgi:hypothetical protein
MPIVGVANIYNSKHPAYIGVHEELQLQVVLDQAFIEAAIATESTCGVGIDKDRSTATTSVKEYDEHDRKECRRIHSHHFLPVNSLLLTDIPPQLMPILCVRTLTALLIVMMSKEERLMTTKQPGRTKSSKKVH